MSHIVIALIVFVVSFVALLALFVIKTRVLKTFSVEELKKTQPSVALFVYKKIIHLGYEFFLVIWKRLSPHIDVAHRATLLFISRVLFWLVRKLSALRDDLRGQASIIHRESTSVFLQDLSSQSAKKEQGVIHG